MKTNIVFEKKEGVNEYLVMNLKDDPLGQIAKDEGKWLFFPNPSLGLKDLRFDKTCLFEITGMLQILEYTFP